MGSRRHPLAALALREHWRVWLLSIALWIAASALWAGAVRHGETLSPDYELPWWSMLIGVLLAESYVVHLHFRSESGSFSFIELPVVLGLLFVDPSYLLPATAIGAFIPFAFIRRQPPIKLLFNLANVSLRVVAAWWILDFLLAGTNPLRPVGWLYMGVATLGTSALEVMAIALVITVTEGSFRAQAVKNMLIFGLLVAAANTVQALVMGLLLLTEPLSLVLLGFSTFVLFVAYRAYVGEREQRERVEFLYSSTQALNSADEQGTASIRLLEEGAAMFRAATVELVLFADADAEPNGSEPEGVQAGTLLIWDQGKVTSRPLSADDRSTGMELAGAANPPVIVTESTPAPWVYLNRRGFRDSMMGTLEAGESRSGLLVVANRLGNVSTFTNDDLQLFSALVQHAAVAMENDQLERALDQLRTLERELAHQASHDGLTGLANRALLSRELDQQLRTGVTDLALLYIDLDDFKLVNDTLGHGAGDQVLVETARRLNAATSSHDTVARLGGDEFAVLLVEPQDAGSVADRILKSLNEVYEVEDGEVTVGASVGLATCDENTDAAQLVSRADVAMYIAKDKGKGTCAVFEEEMHAKMSAQNTLRTQLRSAVANREFRVLYQPIVALESGRVVGAEALVRWASPDGLVLPDGFIGEAERSGLIIPIDTFVFNTVLQDVAVISDQLEQQLFITCNVSMRSLHDPSLFDRVADAVVSSKVPASSIVLEITETALMHDPELALDQLARLREWGVKIALDDFGTGYSSLSYLRRFPVDILKIAQPFVGDLVDGDETFIKAIIDLGHTLGLETLAEGIESQAALDHLINLGCEMGQGFHFARPLVLSDLMATLSRIESRRLTQVGRDRMN